MHRPEGPPPRIPRRSRSRSPLRDRRPRSRSPRSDRDPAVGAWTAVDQETLSKLRKLSEQLPEKCIVLHGVMISFACGCQQWLSATQASSLLKLKVSLERAIAGEITGGVTIEARRVPGARDGREFRALVVEPTPADFSIGLFRLLERELRVQDGPFRPSLSEVLKAKAAAEYWGMKTSGIAATTMLKAVVCAVDDFYPCDPDLNECGIWDQAERLDPVAVRGLAFNACLDGLKSAELISGREYARMEAAVADVESVVTEARRQQKALERGGGYGAARTSASTARKSLLAQQTFAVLHKCVVNSMLPAASSSHTDISNGSAVAATLNEDKEAKGGEHARMFARSCRHLGEKLKQFDEVTRAETAKWKAQVYQNGGPSPSGSPQWAPPSPALPGDPLDNYL